MKCGFLVQKPFGFQTLTLCGKMLSYTLILGLLGSFGVSVYAELPHFPADHPVHPLVLDSSFDRIVGGEIAGDAQFPHQASLQKCTGGGKKSYHFCGGSLYNSRVVVSAGHCARGQSPEPIRICLGRRLVSHNDCGCREVEKIIIHEDYDPKTISNDISLFVLKEKVTFDHHIQPVTLPSKEDYKEHSAAQVSGWGVTKEGGLLPEPNELRYIDIPLLSDKVCKEKYTRKNIEPSMFCAGSLEGGKDSCQGDSGGPLVLKNSSTLVGVVSWGYGCARPSYPGVYTRVERFNEWIKKTADAYN